MIAPGTLLGQLVANGQGADVFEGQSHEVTWGIHVTRAWDRPHDLNLVVRLAPGRVVRAHRRHPSGRLDLTAETGGMLLLAPGEDLVIGGLPLCWEVPVPVPVNDLARCGFCRTRPTGGRGWLAHDDGAEERAGGARLLCHSCAVAFWGVTP